MRALLLRFVDGLHATVHVGRHSKKVVSAKATEKNSIMSDTIGLAVLITSLLVLSQSMRIEFDNQKEND